MENFIFTLVSNIVIIILFINLGLYFRKLLLKDLDDIIEFTAVDLILGISISIFLLFFLSKFIGFENASYILFIVMLFNKYNLNILRIKLKFINLILIYFAFYSLISNIILVLHREKSMLWLHSTLSLTLLEQQIYQFL